MVTQPNAISMTAPGGSEALSAMRPLGWDVPPTEPAGRAERHEMTVSSMPDAAGCIPRHDAGCFPGASPAPARWARKQKTAPKDRFNTLISLRKSGAGEGIRTLDPNLGKVPEALTPGYPAHRQSKILYDKSIRYLRPSPPPVSQTYPATCFQVLGICFVEAYDREILSKLPVGA